MLTMNTLIEKKYPVHKKIDKQTKQELIQENADKNCSYLCLLKEALSYDATVSSLLRGWGGIQLFEL